MSLPFKNSIIVWDWNGTIVDDAALFVLIMNFFLKKNSLKKINLQKYKTSFCFPVENYYKKLGFDLTEDEFKSLSSDFIKFYKKKMFIPGLKSGVFPVIEYLFNQSCKQFVVSAQEQNLLLRSVKHYGVSVFFDGVFGLNNNYAKSKLSCVKKHISPLIDLNNKVLFIGDTAHDYEVARAVGADCCLVSWGHYTTKRLNSLGCYVANSPHLLLAYIKLFINN